MKQEIEEILRKDCSENVENMTAMLTQGRYEMFDLYVERYKVVAAMLKTRGHIQDFQMDTVVEHLYELRRGK